MKCVYALKDIFWRWGIRLKISGVLIRSTCEFSREEDEEYIGKCKKVLIVMSKEFITDMLSLYYMDVIRSAEAGSRQ